MLHPDTELRFISPRIGHGVVATRFIPAGTITWVRDALDQTLDPSQLEAMTPLQRRALQVYAFQDARGDSILCWDHGRFVNHSCAANCLPPGHAFEVAVRDIHPGEQLTDDYATLNLEEGFECACGETTCRGWVGPTDTERLADGWDRQIAAVYRRIAEVRQPLWELVDQRDRVEAERQGRVPIASCRLNFKRAQTDLAPLAG